VVKIRLQRVGAKKQPSYRIVVADSRAPQGCRILENIGFYNPLTAPATVKIDEAQALAWLQKGAQPTDVVAELLKPTGVLEKLAQLKGQSPPPKE